MGTGAAFYVGESAEKDQSPLNYRTNLSFICANQMTIYVVDCHNSQNQVRLHWRAATEPIWSPGRGPDLLDNEEAMLIVHIKKYIESETYLPYFEVSIPIRVI